MVKSELYTKYLKKINLILQDVSKLNSDFKGEATTLEDTEIMDIIDVFYQVINNLENAKMALRDLSKSSKEGILVENEYGKYEIVYDEGGTSFEFSSGFSIELYLDDTWHHGWVKHDPSKGYYFHGDIKTNLRDGMLARSNYK